MIVDKNHFNAHDYYMNRAIEDLQREVNQLKIVPYRKRADPFAKEDQEEEMKVNKNASQRVKGMKQNKRNNMHNQIDEENTDDESDQDS